MINKAEYELNYRVKGKKLTKKIEIDFVAYQRHVDYGELQTGIIDVQMKWNKLKLIENEIPMLIETKPPEYIKTIKQLKDDVEKLSKEIRAISESGIVEKRYNLLKEILIDNGYGEDEDLMSWKFWSNSIEAKSVNELLDVAINKDLDKKKIVH